MEKQEILRGSRLEDKFFQRDVLEIAPDLLGKLLVRRFDSGEIKRYRIIETEAYRGEEDLACHACKGRTKRTDVMYQQGGKVYVYLIYGMYWMLNFVTGKEGIPSATLIREVEGFAGPGKIGRELKLDKSFYGEDISTSSRIWVEDDNIRFEYSKGFRIGINYAGEPWSEMPWRYTAK